MEQVKKKIATLNNALKTLKDSIELFHKYEAILEKNPTKENEQFFLGFRDSMIQRFEYCTDLFWKVLKIYLEQVEKVDIPMLSPRGVIRETVKVKTITEYEGQLSMDMAKNRNETSHIYHEDIAEDIAHNIPAFYKLMTSICATIQKKIAF